MLCYAIGTQFFLPLALWLRLKCVPSFTVLHGHRMINNTFFFLDEAPDQERFYWYPNYCSWHKNTLFASLNMGREKVVHSGEPMMVRAESWFQYHYMSYLTPVVCYDSMSSTFDNYWHEKCNMWTRFQIIMCHIVATEANDIEWDVKHIIQGTDHRCQDTLPTSVETMAHLSKWNSHLQCKMCATVLTFTRFLLENQFW